MSNGNFDLWKWIKRTKNSRIIIKKLRIRIITQIINVESNSKILKISIKKLRININNLKIRIITQRINVEINSKWL